MKQSSDLERGKRQQGWLWNSQEPLGHSRAIARQGSQALCKEVLESPGMWAHGPPELGGIPISIIKDKEHKMGGHMMSMTRHCEWLCFPSARVYSDKCWHQVCLLLAGWTTFSGYLYKDLSNHTTTNQWMCCANGFENVHCRQGGRILVCKLKQIFRVQISEN